MTNDVINKVLYDVDQRADTTAAEKKIARDNIGAVNIKTVSTTLPPVETEITDAKVFTDGRVKLGNVDIGILAPYPSQSDAGKVLVANYAGSPAIGNGRWETMKSDVFVGYWSGYATGHDNTPHADYLAAHNAGKIVYCKQTALGGDILYRLDNIDSSNAFFSRTIGAVNGGVYGQVTNTCLTVHNDDTYALYSNGLQSSLTAGANITISGNIISATAVQTTQHLNVGSPSDTPYNLLTYDGLVFTFMANLNACSLRVSSSDVASISGLVEHVSDSSQVTDGKSLFNNQAISTAYALYNMSNYEMVSTVTEVLKIKLWYVRNNEPKSITMNVLKTGQVDLNISLIGG